MLNIVGTFVDSKECKSVIVKNKEASNPFLSPFKGWNQKGGQRAKTTVCCGNLNAEALRHREK